MKERNPSRVNSQQLTVLFSMVFPVSTVSRFKRFPTKALEFFTLRSSLFTYLNPSVQNLPLEYPPQSPDCR